MSQKFRGEVQVTMSFEFETIADNPREAINFIEEDVQEEAEEIFGDVSNFSVIVKHVEEIEDDNDSAL